MYDKSEILRAIIIVCSDFLADYINYLIKFLNNYNKTFRDLCRRQKISPNDVEKSSQMLYFERTINNVYDKSIDLYKKLEEIAYSYISYSSLKGNYLYFLNMIDSQLENFAEEMDEVKFVVIKKGYKISIYKDISDNKYKGTITGGAAPIENQEVVNDNVTVNKENEENKIMKNVNTEKEDTLMLTGGVSYCHYSDQAENNDIENNTCQEQSEGNTDFYIEDEPEQKGYAGDSIEAAAEYKRKAEEEAKKKAEQQAQQAKQKSAIQTNSNSQQSTANWIMPCNGKIVGQYGEQRKTHVHNGIDIAVPIGTPIKAIKEGKVVAARNASGYGKFVVIEHNINGKIITSEYGHISSWTVEPGQIVKQGQIIAYSGNEGYSQGPHCHLTIRIGKYQGRAVNPWDYISH